MLDERRPAVARRGIGILVLITALGTAFRLPGLSGAGLFYDDAWFALPARMDLGTALRTSVTAPGATLLQAAWTDLGPAGNLWPKLLPLLVGVAAIPATFWLSRVFRLPAAVGLAMAGLVAAAPAAIEYSVRVKEYELDLLLAVVVLAAGELARRDRSDRSLALLVVAGAGSVAMSTSLLVVVAGSLAGLLLIAAMDRRRPLRVLLASAVAGLLCLPSLALISTHIPKSLTTFWVTADRLVGAPYSSSHLGHVVGLTAGGFAHGLLGTPLPASFPRTTVISHGAEAALLVLAVLELAVICLLSAPAVVALLRRQVGSPALAALGSVLSLAIAVVLWAAGLVPLGTGRTDLVLYPSLALLAGMGLRRAGRLVEARWPSRAPGALALASAVGLLALAGLGWHQRSWYPAQDLGALSAKLAPLQRPGDATLVEGRNSYTWAFQGLSPFAVHVDRDDPRARTVGYWVSFTPRLVLDESPVPLGMAATPERLVPDLAGLPASTRRLWLVGTTYANYSPSAFHLTGRIADVMLPTGAGAALGRAGWHRAAQPALRAPGVIAILFVR